MKTSFCLVAASALALAAGSCAPKIPAAPPPAVTQPTSSAPDDELAQLAALIAGNYTSAAQAAADTSYRHIRLHLVPLTSPNFRAGVFFYVEQAAAATPQIPYRQRVYGLRRHPDGRFESVVYALRAPKRFVGAWQNPAQHPALLALTPDSLLLKEGCSVWLRKLADGSYAGGTEGRGCASGLAGARYATSEVTITRRGLRSWDRGFDAQGRQVWGAEKGGYKFVRE